MAAVCVRAQTKGGKEGYERYGKGKDVTGGALQISGRWVSSTTYVGLSSCMALLAGT